MCQYQSTCPTTRHRAGTVCPERLRIEKHNRKVEEHNRQVDASNRANLIALGVFVVGIGAAAIWWFLLR